LSDFSLKASESSCKAQAISIDVVSSSGSEGAEERGDALDVDGFKGGLLVGLCPMAIGANESGLGFVDMSELAWREKKHR